MRAKSSKRRALRRLAADWTCARERIHTGQADRTCGACVRTWCNRLDVKRGLDTRRPGNVSLPSFAQAISGTFATFFSSVSEGAPSGDRS
jgi:hypothetical protein